MKRSITGIVAIAGTIAACLIVFAKPKLSLESFWGEPLSVTLYSFGNSFGFFVVNDGLHSHISTIDQTELNAIEQTVQESNFWSLSEQPVKDPRFGGSDTDRIRMCSWKSGARHVVVRELPELGPIAKVANLFLQLSKTEHRYNCS